MEEIVIIFHSVKEVYALYVEKSSVSQKAVDD
jgi:hypothetical protein